ncbi:unnamed protein product [Didymodactylos carnosus]|uniref:Uncharacterized protein n=1 Tax=Didymodactylos carnosus TaxID=1234261 RepID=A0A814D969_9BILA|nr:unnamed protein product [Didymodactylos carnosus]CAF3730280.1 unnamed protein product [Didymodactylos carnosus]
MGSNDEDMSQSLKTEIKETNETLNTNFMADAVKNLLRLMPIEDQTEMVESDAEQISIRKYDRCKIKCHYVLPLHNDDASPEAKFYKYYKPLVARNQLSFTETQCKEESSAGDNEDNDHDRDPDDGGDSDDREDPAHDEDPEPGEEKPISTFNREILLFPFPIMHNNALCKIFRDFKLLFSSLLI